MGGRANDKFIGGPRWVTHGVQTSVGTERANNETKSEITNMNQALIDYYRFPEGFANFTLAGSLADDYGYFQFGKHTSHEVQVFAHGVGRTASYGETFV